MNFFFLFLLYFSLAWAEDADANTSADSEEESSSEAPSSEPTTTPVIATNSGELIIYGERELARKRGILDTQLREQGYNTVKKKDGRTVYRPDIAWKPSVIIYDEGYMIVRRSPVRFEPWVRGKKENKLRYLSCIPPFIVLCVRSGWLVNERRLAHSKEDVIETSMPSFEAWQEQIIAQATQNRLQNEVPLQLDSLWLDGRSLVDSEQIFESITDRKSELLQFWESRTCTPEGEQVRILIEDYILYEIQNSEYAFSKTELAELPQNACEINLAERLTDELE